MHYTQKCNVTAGNMHMSMLIQACRHALQLATEHRVHTVAASALHQFVHRLVKEPRTLNADGWQWPTAEALSSSCSSSSDGSECDADSCSDISGIRHSAVSTACDSVRLQPHNTGSASTGSHIHRSVIRSFLLSARLSYYKMLHKVSSTNSVSQCPVLSCMKANMASTAKRCLACCCFEHPHFSGYEVRLHKSMFVVCLCGCAFAACVRCMPCAQINNYPKHILTLSSGTAGMLFERKDMHSSGNSL